MTWKNRKDFSNVSEKVLTLKQQIPFVLKILTATCSLDPVHDFAYYYYSH